MQELLAKLNSVQPLSTGLQEHLKDILKVKEFTKEQFVLRPGRICENIYFVGKGLVWIYYENDDSEICSWFLKEGDIAISVVSFFNQVPSFESIQALEDTEVYYITYNELESIYREYPEFNVVARKLQQYYYVLKELRGYSIFSKKAEERYQYLHQYHADLIDRIPDKYLAAYLGMNPSTFSRNKSKYFNNRSV